MPPRRVGGGVFNPGHGDCPTRHMAMLGAGVDAAPACVFFHHSAQHPHKNFDLNIAEIHRNLRLVENQMRGVAVNVGAQNYVVAAITFEVSVGDRQADQHRRVGITFPIKVPSAEVYSFTNACAAVRRDLAEDPRRRPYNPSVDGRAETYAYMSSLFRRGQAKLGEYTCGPRNPAFRGGQGMAQAIRHSEQWLYMYLNTRTGVQELVSRLTTTIRGRGLANYGDQVKVYSVGLHLHSTKTACGVCETSMVGMQNTQVDGQIVSFLSLLQNELRVRQAPASTLRFTHSPRNGIHMYTSYTANQIDGHHGIVVIGDIAQVDIKAPETRQRIFSANYMQFGHRLLEADYLADADGGVYQYTLFVSASDERGAPTVRTRRAARYVREERDDAMLRDLRVAFDAVALNAEDEDVLPEDEGALGAGGADVLSEDEEGAGAGGADVLSEDEEGAGPAGHP